MIRLRQFMVVTVLLNWIWNLFGLVQLSTVLPSKLQVSSPDSDKQWLDCDDDMSIIPFENASFFYPDEPGNYAVELERFGCKDTSECVYFINTVGLEDNTSLNKITVSPNPSEKYVFD